MVATYPLPDGRTLIAEPHGTEGDWHLLIEGERDAEVVGQPLNSSLADLLGHHVAHEEWPSWIDDLAAEVERSLW